MSHVHIIGGGLAGLSAAVELAAQAQVTLYESGPACGGRARSYYERVLDTRIDNGNHLFLSANALTFRYLGLIGARDTLAGPGEPLFPWFDLANGRSWVLRPSRGKIPYWLLPGGKRVPGMHMSEILSIWRLLRAGSEKTVAECLRPGGALTRGLLTPLAVSVLNTDPEVASAKLMGDVLRRSLMQGGEKCCPWFAKTGLSESFVDPALAYLERYHAEIRTGLRVSKLRPDKGRIAAIDTSEGRVFLEEEDRVILAVPAPVAQGLLPGLEAPDEFESIINAHFRLPEPVAVGGPIGQAGFVGLVGGLTEWLFLRNDVVSVTISAASRFQEMDSDAMLKTIWSEIRQVLNPLLETALPDSLPPVRLIREKRATFAATPEQNLKRPGAATPYSNLALAGDWTNTGLPSTIEGAIQSGLTAVAQLGFRSAAG